MRNTLGDETLDRAFVAEAVLLPSESFIGDQMAVVDPDAIHAAREGLRARLGRELEAWWRAAYAATAANRFELSPAAKGARRLRTVALGYPDGPGAADAPALALTQYRRRRQHDRPAGRARHPRQRRRRPSGSARWRLSTTATRASRW